MIFWLSLLLVSNFQKFTQGEEFSWTKNELVSDHPYWSWNNQYEENWHRVLSKHASFLTGEAAFTWSGICPVKWSLWHVSRSSLLTLSNWASSFYHSALSVVELGRILAIEKIRLEGKVWNSLYVCPFRYYLGCSMFLSK